MTDAMRYAERLAALLDGRVDEAERAHLLELLATSDAAFAAFVDAAKIRATDRPAVGAAARGSESAGDAPDVAPPLPAPSHAASSAAPNGGRYASPVGRRSGRPRARSWWKPLVIAAGVAGVVLAASLLVRSARAPDPGPHEIAALVAPRPPEAAAWQADAWTSTRAAGDPLTYNSRAVRIGALLVALELALRETRPDAAGIADELVILLDGVTAGGPLAYMLVPVREDPTNPANAGQVASVSAAATRQLPADRLTAGAWLEAARVAASSRDASFFAQDASRTALTRARALDSLPPGAAEALARITSALPPAAATPDWAVLDSDLTLALRLLAS